ncbi:8423_t:CDS:1, partial [Racocetra fulgida]
SNYLSPEIIQALQLLYLKIENLAVSNNFYENVLKIFKCSNASLHLVKKKLQQLVSFEETKVEMCINSCQAFTEEFIEDNICQICGESRYDSKENPRKFAIYFPLIPRLRIQYADPTCANQLRYRANYKQDNETIRDIYNGKLYKEILEEGLLPDDRDI